jgi:hypothetical protein
MGEQPATASPQVQPQADPSVVDKFIEKYAPINRDGAGNYHTSFTYEPISTKRALNAALFGAIEALNAIGKSTVETVEDNDNGYVRRETHEVGLYPSEARRMQNIMTDIPAMIKMGAKPQPAEHVDNGSIDGEKDSIDTYPKAAPKNQKGNTIPETEVEKEIREFLNETLSHPLAALTQDIKFSEKLAAMSHPSGEPFTGNNVSGSGVRTTTGVGIV